MIFSLGSRAAKSIPLALPDSADFNRNHPLIPT